MTTVITGNQIPVFRAKVIAQALRMYAKTGMKPNRAYTPKNMLAVATHITGKTFKRGQYLEAAAALDAWVDSTAQFGESA